jgi:DNA-binding LacI/PurR family transcriptional regulator
MEPILLRMARKQDSNGRKEPVTMRTIAEEAGVTLTTVSRILNFAEGKYKYAEKTRRRVLAIAERLKYRPNALVRGMQTGRTGTAGVMVPANGYYSEVVVGIHEELFNNNTIMLLSWNHRSLNNREEKMERRIIHQMIDRRVDGIILRPSSEDFARSYFEEIWERDIPLILIDRHLSKIDTDFVGTDDVAGGRMAAEHLLALGHRNLLFIGARTSVSTSRQREEGFRRVLSETPNAYCRSLYEDQQGTMTDDLSEAFLALLKGEDRPTGLFCYNDVYAHKAVSVVQRAGFSVPGDLSIVGFGNQPTNEGGIPLTTFDQHPAQIGQLAAQMYLNRISNRKDDGTRAELVTPDLVLRASTGPVSGGSVIRSA